MKVIVCEETRLGSGTDISVIEADENIGILTQLKHLANEEYKILASDGKEKPQVEVNENSAHVYCGDYSIHFDVCQPQKSKVIEGIKEKIAKSESMIEVVVPVYLDALALMSKNPDLKEAVIDQIMQGDPAFEDVEDEVGDIADELGYDDDAAIEIYQECDIAKLMEYVIIDESRIDINYGETYEARDARIIVYDIPCIFDTQKFLSEQSQEIERRSHQVEME